MSISVSIIVPVFNAADTLTRTLDSIQNQSLQKIETVCVDDCSTDHSLRVLQDYACRDPRFKVVALKRNGGVAAARNTGIAHARGQYICFLDADDWWHKDKLSIQLDYMEVNGIPLTYMSYGRVDEKGSQLQVVVPPAHTSYKKMLSTNVIGNLTAMVRRELITECGVTFKKVGHEDYVFWLAVLQHIDQASCVPSEVPLCFYTVRQESLSSNKLKAAKWQWHIYRKKLGLSFLRTCRYFMSYVIAACLKRRH